MFNQKVFLVLFSAMLVVFMVMTACSQQQNTAIQLPAKAKQAIAEAVPGGKITSVKKELEDGKEVFEVVVAAGDKSYEFDVTPEGVILDQEEQTSDEETEEEEKGETVFRFDSAVPGKLPAGWSNQKTGRGGLGSWSVLADSTAPSMPNVLAQTSKENPGYHFNLAVAEQTNFPDLEIELKFKAMDGQEDQGGGPVWRYQDADNYYICRANPLESNYRVYKVVDGNRKQLQSVNVEIPSNVWHTLKVKNVGNHIQCWYDGVLYLDLTDDTFTSGKVGLWTKADAVTYFDDFEIEEEE